MGFVPRTTAPNGTEKYWILDECGGYNKCWPGNGSSTSALPNCVGYAWGRFYEINGSCNLSTSNAKEWWGNTSDGYKRGKTPQLGAVICFYRADGGGHVGIVEKINDDGSIFTSNSGWSGSRFYTQTLSPPNYSWDSRYIFQGFIYSSNYQGKSKVEEFIEIAEEHIGDNGKWASGMTGCLYKYGNEWSCAYIHACALSCKIDDVIIPATNSVTDLLSLGESKKMGTIVKGPLQGVTSTPKVGDISVCAVSTGIGKRKKYTLTTAGIVCNVNDDTVTCIEGNGRGGKVAKSDYSVTKSKDLYCYYRPDWSKVEVVINSASGGGGLYGRLYDTENTREDASIREIGYISNDIQPSIKTSDIKLSIINYTTHLNAVFDAIVASFGGGFVNMDVDISDFSEIKQQVYTILASYKYKHAAIIGIMANIEQESQYKPDAIGDGGTSGGLCQWHDTRFSSMVNYVGSDWRTDVRGQMDYMHHELTTSYKSVEHVLQTCVDDFEGCKQCVEKFCRVFEVPANTSQRVAERQKIAEEFWNKVIPQQVLEPATNSVADLLDLGESKKLSTALKGPLQGVNSTSKV